MATTNYTTKTAAFSANKADMRQVAVSKKITIGGGTSQTEVSEGKVKTNELDATTVNATSVVAPTVTADTVMVKHEGQSKDVVGLISEVASSIKTGIDIGTKDNPYDNDDDASGFLGGVSKINFKGAFVNVIKKDDGTVDLWINPDNNYGKLDAASCVFTAPANAAKKYVYDGDSYDIPVSNGSQTSSAICHSVSKDPSITLKGKKDGTASTTFSIGNLTSKIKAVVYDKAGTAKATCTSAEIKGGVADANENGIKIDFTNVKEYKEADAEDGFVPGTVSLQCVVTPDISAIFGEGNTWSMKVFLVEGDDETILKSSDTYYAYTTKQASISASPTVAKKELKYRWVSGVKYIASGSTFTVTYGDMSNTTYMVGSNATKRGTIALSGCGDA